jgi:hypothetical protein
MVMYGLCRSQYGGYTCDCPGHWYGDVCEYTEINRTGVCIDTFETLGRLYDLFVTHFNGINLKCLCLYTMCSVLSCPL